MPRGKYQRRKKPPTEWTFENTISADGIEYLIYRADACELAAAICALCDPASKVNILAHILQSRLDRLTQPPANLAELGEKVRSFAPQPMENPDNAETGTESA